MAAERACATQTNTSFRTKDPTAIFWTKTAEGKPMTEIGSYWARVEVWLEGKYAFTVSVPLTPSSGWEEDLRGMKGARE
jgi:hypothetical protein